AVDGNHGIGFRGATTPQQGQAGHQTEPTPTGSVNRPGAAFHQPDAPLHLTSRSLLPGGRVTHGPTGAHAFAPLVNAFYYSHLRPKVNPLLFALEGLDRLLRRFGCARTRRHRKF